MTSRHPTSERSVSSRNAMSAELRRIAPVVVVLITLVTFLPALRNEFVQWDDAAAFLTNPRFRGLGPTQLRWMFTTFYTGIYRPLTWMTYGGDFLLWGMDPFGYHLTNVLLHAANALLVYLLARRLLAAAMPDAVEGVALPVSATVAALFFAVHPLRAEPVAWVSARADLLSAFFLLLSVLAYLRHSARIRSVPWRSGWLAASVGLYAVSLLAKPVALTFPFVLLILDVYPLRRLGAGGRESVAAQRLVWLEKLPFLVLAVAMVPIILQAKAESIPNVTGSKLLLGAALSAYGLAFHVWKAIAPLGLSPLYEMPARIVATSWPFLLSVVVVLAITVLLLLNRSRWPGALAAWVSYAVILAPISGVIPYGPQMAADRYTYLACIGFAVLGGGGLLYLWRWAERGTRQRRVAIAGSLAALVILATLAGLTLKQVGVWRDSETLWSYTVAVEPASSVAQSNLGLVLIARGHPDEARAHLRRAVDLDPGNAANHLSLAAVLFVLNQAGEARKQVGTLLALTSDTARAYRDLGNALFAQARLEDARQYLELALHLSPGNGDAENVLGVVLVNQHKLDEAKVHFRRAVQIQSDYSEAHNNLGNVLLNEGKVEEAVQEYAKAVKENAGSVEARVNLADALVASRKLDAAAEQYRRALQTEPWNARANNNFGLVLMRQGQIAEAIRHFERALQSTTDFPGARQNLEAALAQSRR
jgi:Tfp pilus assembly protein PilF